MSLHLLLRRPKRILKSLVTRRVSEGSFPSLARRVSITQLLNCMAACLVFVVVLGCGGNDELSTEDPANPPKQTTEDPQSRPSSSVVSTADLAKAYIDDSASAGEKYGFKFVTLEGELIEVKRIDDPKPAVNINLKGIDREGGDPVLVQCTLKDPTATVDAKAGQTVKIKGQCTTMVIDRVIVIEAEVVNIEGVAAVTSPPVDAPKNSPSAKTNDSPSNSLDVRYIAPQFFGALVLHPQKWKATPAGNRMYDHLYLNGLINPRFSKGEVARVILLLELTNDGELEDPTMIVQMSDPTDTATLLSPFTEKHGEHTYYQLDSGVVFLPDDQSFIATKKETLFNMLATGDSPPSPLAKRLKQLPLSSDFSGVLIRDPVRQFVDQVDGALNDEMPKALSTLAESSKQIQAIDFHLDLAKDPALNLSVIAGDPDAATAIHKSTQSAIELGRTLWPELKNQIGVPEGPVLEAIDHIIRNAAVKQLDSAMLVEVARPPAFEQAIAGLVAMANSLEVDEKNEVNDSPAPAPKKQVVKRTWKDNSGKFSVVAELVELTDVQVSLKKDTGKTLVVPIDVLSDEDQAFLNLYRAMKNAKPVEVDPTFSSTVSAKAVTWLNEHNVFGVGHQLVKDVEADVKRMAALGRPVVVKLGPGLLKSGKMTLVAAQGNDFFALVPPAETVAEFPERSKVVVSAAELPQTGHARSIAKLSSLSIANGTELLGTKNVTGSVEMELIGAGQGTFALRLVCMAGNHTVTLYHFLDEGLPLEKSKLDFSFDPVISGDVRHTGAMVVFVELVSFVDPSGEGDTIVTSNAVAEVVNVISE